MDITQLSDKDLAILVENRWKSSDSIWSTIKRVWKKNTAMYDMDYDDKDRIPDYLRKLTARQFKVRANRIFTNVEAVINSIIANPPKPNILAGRNTPQSIALAQLQEQYFINRYDELNVKEVLRKALRNLYFGRLLVIKVFWNAKINDFDCMALDPRKVRIAKNATNEVESEFVIEEIEDSLEALIAKFPDKKDAILSKNGMSEERLKTENPQVTYKEAWIKDQVIFKFEDIILGKIRNPYWDWDGILATQDEIDIITKLENDTQNPNADVMRKGILQSIRLQQDARQQEIQAAAPQNAGLDQNGQPLPSPQGIEQGEFPQNANQTAPVSYQAYRFNHFDVPRKPYIFATILNNEQKPIGRTDFITEATPLQEAVDRRKRQLDENAEMMNGWLKVDSSVMGKEDAQKLRYETTGIVYGKGVAKGVARETGAALPEFIYTDMIDSRSEIDNIMAATSAFRGEREGQETKAGRLALIEQSFLRLNELVQVVDYSCRELFNWFYQLAKVRYTEIHYAKTMGEGNALKILELQQDDFQDGTEIRVIPGKTLPEDKEFKFERAQKDVAAGIISPVDYFAEAGYQNPSQLAKNAVVYQLNKPYAVGITPEEMQQIAPQTPQEQPSQSISYKDLPPEGQVQLAAKAGIQLDINNLVAQQAEDKAMKAAEAQAKAKQPAIAAK